MNLIKKSGVHIRPIDTFMYIPPMVWKGDPLGHIGENDVFFWVLEGECFLKIDSEYSIIRAGQLAFLPKGKFRSYTQTSEQFTMYEMAFSASIDEKNLMAAFGMCDGNYVIDIENKNEMSRLFERSYRTELNKNPLYDMIWCSNILNIINIYCEIRQSKKENGKLYFSEVIKYMENNLDKSIKIDDLASIVYMQSTYFIRKFKKEFGVPPLAYFSQLKIYKAMELLAATELSVEEISTNLGLSDSAYFSRFFKKICKVTPTEYRKAFQRN